MPDATIPEFAEKYFFDRKLLIANYQSNLESGWRLPALEADSVPPG